ncbi:MAG TPA: sulfurtransferase FdhD, partial [Achromobacter sp.]|nr:sulfurtransferase FdhD [Achromobacter sp.]
MTSQTTPPPPRPDCTPTQVTRVRGGTIAPAAESDFVAEETPVALEFNGISHATMLATPA